MTPCLRGVLHLLILGRDILREAYIEYIVSAPAVLSNIRSQYPIQGVRLRYMVSAPFSLILGRDILYKVYIGYALFKSLNNIYIVRISYY